MPRHRTWCCPTTGPTRARVTTAASGTARSFDRAAGGPAERLLALYIERVCSNVEVFLNGHRVFSGGRMSEPFTRNCYTPQLVSLPAALLQTEANLLDLQVQGHALERVAARQRAGGLSALQIGPQAVLADAYNRQAASGTCARCRSPASCWPCSAALIAALGWMNRREAYLGYFGLAVAGLGRCMSSRLWLRDLPLDNGVVEFLVCTGFALVTALGRCSSCSATPGCARVTSNSRCWPSWCWCR